MHRVLLVGPLLKTGGVSRFVKDLLGASLGYGIRLFNTARPPKPNTSKGAVGYRTLFAAGVPWAIRNALVTGWNVVRFPFALLWSRSALVHIATSSHWSFWESAIYLICAKLLGRGVVLHYLSDFQRFYGPATTLEKTLIQHVFRAADRVIVLSDSVSQTISSFMSEQSVAVVPSSVELSIPHTGDGRRDDLTERTQVLFMGGNYGVRKGVNDLIAAVPRVLAACSDVDFLLCGGGDVEIACENAENKFRNAVRYLGMVDDTTKSLLLSTVSIYVLPSYSEGMPYGIIEAMASGLAVVATNVGSIPEVVIDGENGLLFSPGDVDALAGSILRLAEDRTLTRRMMMANREKVSKLFSSTRALDVIRKTYDSVLAM